MTNSVDFIPSNRGIRCIGPRGSLGKIVECVDCCDYTTSVEFWPKIAEGDWITAKELREIASKMDELEKENGY